MKKNKKQKNYLSKRAQNATLKLQCTLSAKNNPKPRLPRPNPETIMVIPKKEAIKL